MISSSTAPKQYKLDAALPGQTQVTPLRQVVEAAVDKTEKDGQTRVLYLKSTAATTDQPAQRYMTTKFDSRHEDRSAHSGQSRKIAQTQHQGGTQQLKFLAERMRDLPRQPRKVALAAQDAVTLCNNATLFGLPCTPTLLQQLKEMESAQQAQRSTELTPRQPADTPRSDSEKSQPLQQPDEEESSTASQANVSKSEKSDDSSAPTTGGTPRKVRPSKLVRKGGTKADRQNLEQVRKTNIEKEKQRRVEQAALDIRDLMFPKQSTVQSPSTPRNPPPVAIPSPLPSSASAPLLTTSVSAEIPASKTPSNTVQLSLAIGKEPSGTESSGKPAPTAAQSDRSQSSNKSPGDDLRVSKSHSSPTSPTTADLNPPTSPRELKQQRMPRPSRLLAAKKPATPTPLATPRSPLTDPSSPPTETKPEGELNEL